MKQLVTVGLMCVIACGGSSRAPASQPTLANKPAEEAPAPAPEPEPAFDASSVSDAEFEATMNQGLTMFAGMAAAVDAAAGDCGKLADGMATVMDANQAFFETAKRWKGSAEIDQRAEEWFKGKMEAMMPDLMKIGAAGQQCAADARFAAVMKRMDELK